MIIPKCRNCYFGHYCDKQLGTLAGAGFKKLENVCKPPLHKCAYCDAPPTEKWDEVSESDMGYTETAKEYTKF